MGVDEVPHDQGAVPAVPGHGVAGPLEQRVDVLGAAGTIEVVLPQVQDQDAAALAVAGQDGAALTGRGRGPGVGCG